MNLYPQFTEWLKQALWDKHLNARQLALRIGVSPSYITRMLSGERNPPADDLILKIADALELDPDTLLIQSGRLPRCLSGCVSAVGQLTEDDIQTLKRAADQIRARHRGRQRRKDT